MATRLIFTTQQKKMSSYIHAATLTIVRKKYGRNNPNKKKTNITSTHQPDQSLSHSFLLLGIL